VEDQSVHHVRCYHQDIAGHSWTLVPLTEPLFADNGGRRLATVDVAARVILFDDVAGQRAVPRLPLALAIAGAVCRAWESEISGMSDRLDAELPVDAHRDAAAPTN
jgi:hypothetical protein